jgi:hypothetical protein
MTEAEAREWVLRRVKAWAGEEAGVLELVQKLGCLPLAIEQAAAFAEEYNIETPALYLAEQVSAGAVRVRFDLIDFDRIEVLVSSIFLLLIGTTRCM